MSIEPIGGGVDSDGDDITFIDFAEDSPQNSPSVKTERRENDEAADVSRDNADFSDDVSTDGFSSMKIEPADGENLGPEVTNDSTKQVSKL